MLPSPNNAPDVARDYRVDRRGFLRLSGGLASGVVVGGLLVACGGGDSQPTAVPTQGGSGGADSGSSPTVTASGSQPTASQTATPSDRVVRITQGIDVKTWDPHQDGTTSSIAIFHNVFDSLIYRDDELKIVPWLAEKWEVVDDTTWEFTLHPDVTFHDGTPFTADDMVFSFENLANAVQKSRITMVDHVEAADDTTFRIITKTPYPALLTVLHYAYALPAKQYQDMGPEKFAVSPIGTGAYRLSEWVKDDHISLERFDDHFRGPAPIASAEIRPRPESATRVASLLAGEVDVATLVPAEDVDTVNANTALEIRAVRSLRTIYIGMNCFNEPFTDVRVRRALNHAVDIQEIIDTVLGGHGYRLGSVSGPFEFGFNPDVPFYEHDPEKAKSLLVEAGYPDGFSTVLDTPIGRYLQDVEVAQAIGGQLAKVGVKVDVKPQPYEQLNEKSLNLKLEGLYLLGWGASQIDADGVLGQNLDSKRGGRYYNSPKSDELIQAAAVEMDPDKREAIYQEIMQYMHDEAPWIFLYSQEDIYGVSKELAWSPAANESLNIFQMSWKA